MKWLHVYFGLGGVAASRAVSMSVFRNDLYKVM